jgi:RNA polymerase sigma-70 factor, ECF subfamily
LAIDQQRADTRRRQRDARAGMLMKPLQVEEAAASGEFERLLMDAIDALPGKLRMVMVLAGIEGYDTREAALLLRLPEGTVKSRLHAARKKLAERLQCFARNTSPG